MIKMTPEEKPLPDRFKEAARALERDDDDTLDRALGKLDLTWKPEATKPEAVVKPKHG